MVENIRRLRDMQFPLSIAVTPNAFMTDGEAVIRFLQHEGFHYSINAGIMQPREETGRATADASLDTYISMMKLRAALRGTELAAEPDPESLPDTGCGKDCGAVGVTCGAGRSTFSVDWQGLMRPCNTFPCEGEAVLSQGFSSAWKKIHYIASHYPLPAECQGCAYQGVCKHCVAEHASGAEPGHASTVICAMGKRMVIEGLLTLQQPE